MDEIQSNLGQWVLPLATALIAWGGFPQPPEIFVKLSQYELFQYLLVFILIWQGGAKQDPKTALIATAIVYIISKMLEIGKMMQNMKNQQAMQAAQMQAMAAQAQAVQQEGPQVMSPDAMAEHFRRY